MIVVITSFWVLFDAKTIGIKKGQIQGIGDMGPVAWFFLCLFVWFIGFPTYLLMRPEFKRVNRK